MIGRVSFMTIDATDPKSGTAEFKACAVRVEELINGEQAFGAMLEAARQPAKKTSICTSASSRSAPQ